MQCLVYFERVRSDVTTHGTADILVEKMKKIRTTRMILLFLVLGTKLAFKIYLCIDDIIVDIKIMMC